jgi:hypothetical protein
LQIRQNGSTSPLRFGDEEVDLAERGFVFSSSGVRLLCH